MMRSFMVIASMCVLLVTVGCDDDRKDNTQRLEQNLTEEQQEVHLKAVPMPQLKTSQERKNLVRRLETFNTEDKVSYIYLVNYGKVMAFYTVKGKVSSVNSLLTTPDQIVDQWHGGHGYQSHVVSSPDLDGSYGTNGDAIFFFTTDGTYVEWKGDYMLCDKPLKLSTPPQMVIEVKDEQ